MNVVDVLEDAQWPWMVVSAARLTAEDLGTVWPGRLLRMAPGAVTVLRSPQTVWWWRAWQWIEREEA